ncbi:hypothetical protein [Fodinicola feengrottensis]|nr:hypothetical protein [Fodinicola feengrottensis]
MTAGALTVTASVRTNDVTAQSTTGFGWRVLTAVADSVRSWLTDVGGGIAALHIQAVKVRR